MQSQVDAAGPRRPHRQDTFDLRDQLLTDEHSQLHPGAGGGGNGQHAAHGDIMYTSASDEEHSVLEDDSSDEGDVGDYVEDDQSSELSIPNESIDFDLVYSLTNFAATVEGQASVVKGDSLFLMDDSNSYWWLVRVLKTQEVGYIPAENIETPFERLARLNKHRNVDLASATQAELLEGANQSRENLRAQISSRTGSNAPSPVPGVRTESRNAARSQNRKSVCFTPSSNVFRYPPAVWNEEEEDGEDDWDEDDIEYEDQAVKDDPNAPEDPQIREDDAVGMEPDDGMHWDEDAAEEMQARQALRNAGATPPAVLRPGPSQQQQIQPVQSSQQQPGVGAGPALTLRHQTSRERLYAQQQQQEAERAAATATSGSGPMIVDPAEVTETKKVVITPPVARDSPSRETQQAPSTSGPLLPSAILQQQQLQQEQERKRAREEIEAAEEAARKKAKESNGNGVNKTGIEGGRERDIVRTPSMDTRSSASSGGNGGSKLRKERSNQDVTTDEESGKDKGSKKRSGVFGALFGRKKDKDGKEKGSGEKGLREKGASMENINSPNDAGPGGTRASEESGRSSSYSHSQSAPQTAPPPDLSRVPGGPPVAGPTRQPQSSMRGSAETKRAATVAATVASLGPPQQQSRSQDVTSPPPGQQQQQSGDLDPLSLQVSQHASQLRERDQQQQALYQQYLKRSPSSPPDQPSYGLQSASAIMPSSATAGIGPGVANAMNLSPFRTQGGRPGSLILSPADGQALGGIGVPELSVIRVFAGRNLQSEATFKTVLLNTSTTAGDLVRQAMQRFRLAAGENAADYYLTIKQVEGGSSAALRPEERPLGVFEDLVERALEMPKVKRSSMGSISSVASNLSAHPAIRKLAMNDFTDDSAVKFYLNRRGGHGKDDSVMDDDEYTTAETSQSEDTDTSRNQFLRVNTSSGSNVSPERFSSPSFRFVLQLVIYPEELPDDMVFDPHTEAIVFKNTLRDRSQSSSQASPGISQYQRKKVFVFPKNITVAEVIELGLERFGILEGVVDGGDEVEDKLSKRRSMSSRVRYTLTVQVDGQEKELPPSTKVIDAFPRPPAQRRSGELKRRSVDSAHLLGSLEDVQPDDPIFVLRRATTYRSSASSRHRLSAPLDEIALSHLHRESASNSSVVSESSVNPASSADEGKPRQPSRQEIIAAQRAASRANQKAILSTQANSHRGVDVLLPGKAMLRSSRYDVDDKMRYSYVQPDGETYDISDIIEEEFNGGPEANQQRETMTSPQGQSGDLLKGVVNRYQPGVGAKLIDRVLNKINGKNVAQMTMSQSMSAATLDSSGTPPSSASSFSEYSLPDQEDSANTPSGSRSATPTSASIQAQAQRAVSPPARDETRTSRSRTTTPTVTPRVTQHAQQPSIASVISDISGKRSITPTMPQSTTPTAPKSKAAHAATPQGKKPVILKDEFGMTDMMAVIEVRAAAYKHPRPEPLDEVDELLFGPTIDVKSLHPQIREVYGNTFKKLEEMDAALDDLLLKSMHLF